MTLAISDTPAARQQWQPRLQVCWWGMCPQSQSRAVMSGASLGSAGESRAVAAARLCSPRTGTLAMLLPRGSQCLRAVNTNEAIRLLLLLEIKRSCKQSGRAFTFTHVFWSMPKCRTWKSAYGKGETCIYSIKSRPYGEIYDVNGSITVVMYLMWCDSAEATAPLDWFILAESLTQGQFCLLLSCCLRMNLNKIHVLSF